MGIPQLTGGLSMPPGREGRMALVAVVVLAAVLATILWQFRPMADVSEGPTSFVPAGRRSIAAQQRADRELHLEHAEQDLVLAAEQLAAARRMLAALSPALNRNYLTAEKRRVDSAWSACDLAQRAIEQARTDIATFIEQGKE